MSLSLDNDLHATDKLHEETSTFGFEWSFVSS